METQVLSPVRSTITNPTALAMAEHMRSRLLIHKGQKCSHSSGATCRKCTVEAYGKSIAMARGFQTALYQLLADTVTSNIRIFADGASAAKASELMQMARNTMCVPRTTVEPQDILRAELAAKGPDAMLQECRAAADAFCDEIVAEFFDALNEMAEANSFGLINFLLEDPTVCIYSFYRTIVCQTHLEDIYKTRYERKDAGDGTVEDWTIVNKSALFNRKMSRERHEHHVYEATSCLANQSTTRKPSFVSHLVSRIPEIARPFVKIVAGEMIREDVKIAAVSDETIRVNYGDVSASFVRKGLLMSPAVTIDRYVLCGWSDADFR